MSNKFSFINCYNHLDGYFLDNDIFRQCYSNCKTCNEYGDENNHKCIECNDDYILIESNCYIKCPFYYYFDENNQYFCTDNNECPTDYNKIIKEKNKCINNCTNDKDYKNEYNNYCYLLCPEGTVTNNKCENITYNQITSQECNPLNMFAGKCSTNNMDSSYKDKMILYIQKEIQNKTINITLLKDNKGKSKDLLAKEEAILYKITSSEILNNIKYNYDSIYYNYLSIIDLECEDQLRSKYKISDDISLLIFQIEIYIKGLYIPIIEYEIYNSETNEKLNLDNCDNTKIKINILVTINESNLFKHNMSNEYYNDECNPYTTDIGTDIIIKDRRNEFKNNNMWLCEKNCDLIGYNEVTKRAICECEVKKKLTLFSNVQIDIDKFLKGFDDIQTSSNINTIKCYQLIFSISGFASNL